MYYRLFCLSGFYRNYAYKAGHAETAVELANHFTLELYHTVYNGVEGRVATYTDVLSRVKFGAALLHNNFTFSNSLIAKYFNAEPFRD